MNRIDASSGDFNRFTQALQVGDVQVDNNVLENVHKEVAFIPFTEWSIVKAAIGHPKTWRIRTEICQPTRQDKATFKIIGTDFEDIERFQAVFKRFDSDSQAWEITREDNDFIPREQRKYIIVPSTLSSSAERRQAIINELKYIQTLNPLGGYLDVQKIGENGVFRTRYFLGENINPDTYAKYVAYLKQPKQQQPVLKPTDEPIGAEKENSADSDGPRNASVPVPPEQPQPPHQEIVSFTK